MNISEVVRNSVVLVDAAILLYTATVTAAALTALVARAPTRRRAARDVLKILLRHPHDSDQP